MPDLRIVLLAVLLQALAPDCALCADPFAHSRGCVAVRGNYRLQADGPDGGQVLDAERWGPDDWRFTGPNYTGMLISTRGGLVTHIANMIGQGKIRSFRIMSQGKAITRLPGFGHVQVDRLGGTWVHGEGYAPFPELIEALIPEEWDSASDG